MEKNNNLEIIFGKDVIKPAIIQKSRQTRKFRRATTSMNRCSSDCQRGWLSILAKFCASGQLIFVKSRPIVSVRFLEMEARLGSSCNRDMDQPELVGISTSALNE